MKHLTHAFTDIPCLYVLCGLIVSAYHAYRGYVLQRWTAQTQEHDAQETARMRNTTFRWFMSQRETIAVRYVYDCIFHFFWSIVGFGALWLAISVSNALPNIYDIPAGTGALVAFLFVVGLLGISGILPWVIQLGKLPR